MPSTFYSFGPILSRNAVYNFVVGARGVGKTYGAKRKGIKDFLRDGSQFIYLRRYATELKGLKANLFADIMYEFPNHMLRVMGDEIQIAERAEAKLAEWRVMGWYVALSKSQQKKSTSYPNVKLIIFDEFILETGAIRYLPAEARKFNDFYSTVDRYNDRVRVLFLANAVSIMNPYFIEWNIRPENGQEWFSAAKGFICAHFPDSTIYTSEVYKTRFGQFIEGTDYATYSVASQFADNSDAMLEAKTPGAAYAGTIETKTGTFSLWIDPANGVYLNQRQPRTGTKVFTLLPERMGPDKQLIEYTHPLLTYIRSQFSAGRVGFDSAQTRNAYIGAYRR